MISIIYLRTVMWEEEESQEVENGRNIVFVSLFAILERYSAMP